MQKIIIKTWGCNECKYTQDFEPTEDMYDVIFNLDYDFQNVVAKRNNKIKKKSILDKTTPEYIGKLLPPTCPNCYLNDGSGEIVRETDDAKKSKMAILESGDEVEVGGEKRKAKSGEYKSSAEIKVLKDKYEDK